MFTVSFVYEADDMRLTFGPFPDLHAAAVWARSACESYCAYMNASGEDYQCASSVADVEEECCVKIYDRGRFHELDEVYFLIDRMPEDPSTFDPSKLFTE